MRFVLEKSHANKVVKIDGSKVVEVPNGTFAKGDVVVMFNNTDEFVCIETKVPKSYVSARQQARTMVEFPPRALGNILFVEDDIAVFSGDMR